EERAELPAVDHGLTTLPFWAGERSPHGPLGATATSEGLTADTTPVQIVQASLEAVAYRLAYLKRRIRERFPEADTIVGSGTALRESEIWGRIIADTFGEPVVVAAEEEASARGVCLLALVEAVVLRDTGDAEFAVAGTIHAYA